MIDNEVNKKEMPDPNNEKATEDCCATPSKDTTEKRKPSREKKDRTKDFSWAIYTTPVMIAVLYVALYVFILPRIVFERFCGLLEWLLFDPKDFIESLRDPSTIFNSVYMAVGTKVLGWVLIAAFLASLFWVGYTIQNKKPKINGNAKLIGTQAYLTAMELHGQMKLITEQNVTAAVKAIYSVCERLKYESKFGSGSMDVINCENEIAACLEEIEGNIPGLRDEESAPKAIQNIEMLCQKILSKLKIRIELKRK